MRHRSFYNPEDTEAARQFKRFLNDLLYEKGLKVNQAAAKLNINAERLYKYLNENAGNNNLPAYLIPHWTKLIGEELLSFLAYEAGYAVAKLPSTEESLKDILQYATRAMKECSEAIEKFAQVIEDGKVTYQEFRSLKKEVREAISALLSLEKMSEAMREKGD